MADDKEKSPLMPVSVVAVILAALGVTLFVQPFKGSRPPVSEYLESYRKINARLWQDPFQAVLDGVKQDQTLGEGIGKVGISPKQSGSVPLKKAFLGEIENAQEVTLLAFMVPGGIYFEDTENRMRWRYALLAGLSRVGFVSEDAEHVEFINILSEDEKTTGKVEKVTLSNIIPIELLKHDKEKAYVLVLWISEGAFEKTPLSKLDYLCAYLKEADKLRNATFKIIGPATSDGLLDMVQEVSKTNTKNSNGMRFVKDAVIYSAVATVDDARLLESVTGEAAYETSARAEIEKRFSSHGITFVRTIGTDRALVYSLIQELERRGVNLGKKQNHLLLVAEWDTYYTRSLNGLFKDTLLFKKALQEQGAPDDGIDRRVHFISYLRGIDGSVPGESGDKERKDASTQGKGDASGDIKKLEQPIGKSQYDYLRRLAAATYELNERLRAKGPSEEIKAIGVVGTDFYDKYLVLQALRQQFPDTIFFTTDLDARFLHPDNIKWTRNLVVASNFNLSLRRDEVVDVQGEAPPFRDNYQTSIFLTVLRAFPERWLYVNERARGHLHTIAKKESAESDLRPLIFEIGRHRAVGLTDPEDAIRPPRDQVKHTNWFYIKIGLTIVLGLVVIFLARPPSKTLRGLLRKHLTTSILVTAGTLLLLVGFGCAVYLISRLPNEEPFSVLEGISVWPTEILRFLAFLLSILFLYMVGRGREENRKTINRTVFGLRQESSTPRPDKDGKTEHRKHARTWRRMIRKWWQITCEPEWRLKEINPKTWLKDVWLEYMRQDAERYHVVRVATILLFYSAFCWLIVSFDWPAIPVRGSVSRAMVIAVSSASYLCLSVLIFYVFDVTRCCRKFIDCLNSPEISALHQPGVDNQERVKNTRDTIRLIAMRTDVVGRLIFYPFIVWLIMFVARIDYFDNWKTPYGLAVIISLGAVLAWICAFLLRRSAEKARTCVVGRLHDVLHDEKENKNPSQALIDYIEFVIDEVRSIRQGAFAPFSQHPVLRALLVPFGGVGSIYLIDFLAKMNF